MGLSGYKLINNRYKNIITLINNMSVNTPPTENIPIFDASVFPSASGTALTIATGQKYFVSYPVAQGNEIFPQNITLQSTLTDATGVVGTAGQLLSSTGTGINWINPGAITGDLLINNPYGIYCDSYYQASNHTLGNALNLFSTTVDDINFANNIPTGKTLQLGNTTTGSVHCCNVGFDLNQINNASAPTGGVLRIGNFQTTGQLNIGGGNTVRTTGAINIANDSTFYGAVNILTGSTTVSPNLPTINMGANNTTITLSRGFILYRDVSGGLGTYKNYMDADAPSTSLYLGNNILTGNIRIGSGLGTGDIYLGEAQTAGGVVNIGSATSDTQIYNTLTCTGKITASGNIQTPTITSTGALSLGTSTSTSVSIGATGITTTNNGSLTSTQLITATAGLTATTGNITASAGSVSANTTLSAGTTITAGTGITSTSGNITASAGAVSANTTLSAGTTITAGTGITSTSGNITASAGSVSANTTLSAGTTITAGTGITATTGNITASSGSITTTSGSITSAGVITGTSVVSPSFNASADTTTVGISTTQTSGVLNIGTGSRTTGGTINIGTGSGAVVNPINIGGTGSALTLNGTVTTPLGLTLGNGYGITCGSSTYTPTTSQIGYTSAKITNASAVSLPASTATTVITISNIPIGNYIVIFSVSVNSPSSATTYATPSATTTGGTLVMPFSDMSPAGGTASTNHQGGSYTGFFNASSSTNSIAFLVNPKAGGTASVAIGDGQTCYMRIG